MGLLNTKIGPLLIKLRFKYNPVLSETIYGQNIHRIINPREKIELFLFIKLS